MAKVLFSILYTLFITLYPAHSISAASDESRLQGILENECVKLKKEKLLPLLKARFQSEIERGLSPDLLNIITGVIKRTDFDGISEEKTAEIISLVNEAHKKGAPLAYLDQIFDVAYAKTVSVDQLYAAANALKEFEDSDVPRDIYEEFVYKGIEDKWDSSAVPVLSRGLIYGVDRGLTPQRVAISIMIDMEKGELKNKGADRLVLDSVKFVRDIEPEKWRPLSDAEKAISMRKGKKREMEERRRNAELNKLQAETEKQRAEEALKKISDKREASRQRLELENRIKTAQMAALGHKKEMDEADDVIGKLIGEIEQHEQGRKRVRNERKKRDDDIIDQKIRDFGLTSSLEIDRLNHSVERYLGIPYRYGGDAENGIDCSAFTRRVYRDLGTELPRTSREQARVGHTVGSNFKAGDLVFFDTSIIGAITHVGVYMENGTFAHASKSQGVTKSSLNERYYSKRFVQANRIFAER